METHITRTFFAQYLPYPKFCKDGLMMAKWPKHDVIKTVAYPGILFGGGGGVQQIQLRTEGRENGDLGAVAP
jgi:hypothetical protein